jgi:hypothetical protein
MKVRRLEVQCFGLFDNSVDPHKDPALDYSGGYQMASPDKSRSAKENPTLFSGRKRVHSRGNQI